MPSPTISTPFASTARAGSSTGLSPTVSPYLHEVAKRYRAQGAEPVAVNLYELQKLGYRVILDNLLEEHGVLRHNPQALAQLLFEEFLSPRRFGKPVTR